MARDLGDAVSDDWRLWVERWVEAGLLSFVQADRIAALETVPGPTVAAGRESPTRGISPSIELIAYFGILLVAVSAYVFISRVWMGMALGWRLVLALGVALVGLAGGRALGRLDGPGARRLAGLAWLFGTGGVSAIVGLGVDRLGRHRPEITAFSVGVAILAISIALWRNRDRPLQFLSFVGGAVIVAISAIVLADGHPSAQVRELFAWSAAILLGLLGVRRLRPTGEVLIVSEIAAIVAAIAISFSDHVWGIVLGLLTTTAATALGLFLQRAPVAVVGALGYFMVIIRVFAVYLRGTVAILGALWIGVALIVIALWRAIRGDHFRDDAPLRLMHLFRHETDVIAPREGSISAPEGRSVR